MKFWIALAAVWSSFVFSPQASAAFQYIDWKTAGDNKALIDTNTGIEWLRLDQVNKKSMNQILSELDTVYAGWRLPTAAEVDAMMSAMYGGATLQFSSAEGRSGYLRTGANQFAYWFGNNAKYAAHHTGMYYDEDGILRITGAYLNEGGAYTITYGLEYTSVLSGNSVYNHQRTGVFLVNDGGVTLTSINNPMLNAMNPNAPVNQVADVNVPGMIGLATLGPALCMFGVARRRDEKTAG